VESLQGSLDRLETVAYPSSESTESTGSLTNPTMATSFLETLGINLEYLAQLRFINDSFTPYYILAYPVMYYFFADVVGTLKAMAASLLIAIVMQRFVLGRRQPVPSNCAVVITGCSTGMGFHTAIRLATMGFTVFATVRKPEHFEKLAQSAPAKAKSRLVKAILDVRDINSIDAAAKQVTAECKSRGLSLQSVINNAGYSECVPLQLATERAISDQYQTNVFGPIHVTNAFLPLLKASKSPVKPTVIFIASVVSHISPAGLGLYSSSKAALRSLASTYRQELSPFGINVVTVEPGFVRTEFLNTALNSTQQNFNDETIKTKSDEETVSLYEGGLGSILTTAQNIKGLSATVDFVSNALVDAVLSNYPPTNYRVGYDSHLTLPFINLTHWLVEVTGMLTFYLSKKQTEQKGKQQK